MQDLEQIRSLRDLRAHGYAVRPVRDEIRQNLLAGLARGDTILPGFFDLHAHYAIDLFDKGRVDELVVRGCIRHGRVRPAIQPGRAAGGG